MLACVHARSGIQACMWRQPMRQAKTSGLALPACYWGTGPSSQPGVYGQRHRPPATPCPHRPPARLLRCPVPPCEPPACTLAAAACTLVRNGRPAARNAHTPHPTPLIPHPSCCCAAHPFSCCAWCAWARCSTCSRCTACCASSACHASWNAWRPSLTEACCRCGGGVRGGVVGVGAWGGGLGGGAQPPTAPSSLCTALVLLLSRAERSRQRVLQVRARMMISCSWTSGGGWPPARAREGGRGSASLLQHPPAHCPPPSCTLVASGHPGHPLGILPCRLLGAECHFALSLLTPTSQPPA